MFVWPDGSQLECISDDCDDLVIRNNGIDIIEFFGNFLKQDEMFEKTLFPDCFRETKNGPMGSNLSGHFIWWNKAGKTPYPISSMGFIARLRK